MTSEELVLVDDDKFLLDMYSQKFTHAGFIVHPCFSTKEALEILRKGTTPNAVIFDITMPGEDGFVLLAKIREEKLASGAKLIALTNQTDEADRKKAEELGVTRYCVKASMIPSEVVNMVKEELGKK